MHDVIRPHDAGGLTAGELDLALARPDSPARVPILAHLSAIDTELAARDAGTAEPGEVTS